MDNDDPTSPFIQLTTDLDKFGNAKNSTINNPGELPGVFFNNNFNVSASNVKLNGFVSKSTQAVSNASTVSAAAAVTLTTQLTPVQMKNIGLRNMAIPYVAIYEGTGPVGGVEAGSAQLFPKIGSGETAEKMRFYGGFDWHDWSGSTMSSLYRLTMYNNSGTSIIIHAVTQWQYIQNNAGTSL